MRAGNERAVEPRVLVAGVKNPLHPGLYSGLDRGAVQWDVVGVGIAGRDEQHLGGTFERVEQGRRVVVRAAPHAHAPIGKFCTGSCREPPGGILPVELTKRMHVSC